MHLKRIRWLHSYWHEGYQPYGSSRGMPLGFGHAYQANHPCPCYNYKMGLNVMNILGQTILLLSFPFFSEVKFLSYLHRGYACNVEWKSIEKVSNVRKFPYKVCCCILTTVSTSYIEINSQFLARASNKVLSSSLSYLNLHTWIGISLIVTSIGSILVKSSKGLHIWATTKKNLVHKQIFYRQPSKLFIPRHIHYTMTSW